jgi:hypothetical protein
MEEVFLPIAGYNGYYISNLGRIKSTKRKTPIILKLVVDRLGYSTAMLYNKEKRTLDTIHTSRLVLAAFLGYPAEPWLCYAHHKNGDITDCRLENLEWLVCETTEEYNPKLSHRKGVLKPKETKARMTQAKFNQSRQTIEKAQISRLKTLEIRKAQIARLKTLEIRDMMRDNK